jgi:hypothetical protein
MSLYFALKLVHVLAMALWVGGPPIAVFGLERALATPAVARDTVDRLLAVTPWFIGAALVTVASGAALVYLSGGLLRVPARILVGAALVVPLFALGGGVTRPALVGLRRHFAGGGDVAAAGPLVRRLRVGHGVEQAVRLVALALMVLPI